MDNNRVREVKDTGAQYGETWSDVKEIQDDGDSVSKFVFTKDNAVAESVLYRYNSYTERTVICCSTQSGCPVGCRFCGAGDNFVRSLTTDEILSQPEIIFEDKNINPNEVKSLQIMFMSMGEPMLNLKKLIPALYELYRKYPKAALLVSTSAPDVNYEPFFKASEDIPTVGLQFSVHESTDEARNKLIPFAKKLELSQIAAVGEEWATRTSRRPYFNYCVHEKNNSDADVKRLQDLFKPSIWESTLSVISERDESVAAANRRQRELVEKFMSKMLEADYSTRMFDPAGQDTIGGGCGQLWFVQEWMKNNPDKARPSAGAQYPKVHTPLPITISEYR